jgi:hypothetical protein
MYSILSFVDTALKFLDFLVWLVGWLVGWPVGWLDWI